MRSSIPRVLGSCVLATLMLSVPTPVAAQKGGSGKPVKPCNPRKESCPDVTLPGVSITSPAAGAIVSGTFAVTGTASDNIGVVLVQVQIDEGPFQPAAGTGSWSFALDSSTLADGTHQVSARATDAAGNVSPVSTRSITVDNRPATDGNTLQLLEVRVDRPTLHAAGVQVLISGDLNRNGRITLRSRRAGQNDWTGGPPLMRVMPETITEVVPPQFAGSVFDLDPDTAYELELHATDIDGNVSELRTVGVKTRPVPLTEPIGGRSVRVATAAALREALAAAQPGDVIGIAAGTYAGPFVLAASGLPDRPIVIRGAGPGTVLDGQNCSSCNVLEAGGSYVHVEHVTLTNAVRGLRFTGTGATGNVVRRVAITNVVHGTASSPGQTDFYICDNVLDGRLVWPWVFGSRPSSHWDDRGIEVTGDGHVVCHNTIRGFGDPVVNGKRMARSWDIYGNDISDSWDGVEMDEGAGNVRLIHNRFTNVMAPVSIQPIFGGPGYVLRNVGFNIPDEQIKLKSLGGVEEPSGVFVYHNTFASPERALNLLSTITQHNFTFANNLFVGPDVLVGTRTVDWRAGINAGSFDYNGYYPAGEFMFGTVAGVDRLYASFAQAQAGSVEANGQLLTRAIFLHGFVGPEDASLRHAPADFRLAADAAAHDRGARLPGINDGFTGAAPDLGALETGCAVPVYGPRLPGSDAVANRVNCWVR